MDPIAQFNEEELLEFARTLLQQALGRLETGDAAAACWRLADALGALSALAPEANGVRSYTGLGYRLDTRKHDNPS